MNEIRYTLYGFSDLWVFYWNYDKIKKAVCETLCLDGFDLIGRGYWLNGRIKEKKTKIVVNKLVSHTLKNVAI
jgi:hypothetical protein